jgi:C_GCAxxG_C_C family probable redox protein
VLLAVSKAKGIESSFFPCIATGLSGGVAGLGEVCGALSGGALVVGLLHGRDGAEDVEAKELTKEKLRAFAQGFAEVNGALRCRDLLGLDISTDEGLDEYHNRGLSERCSAIVPNAVRVLIDVLDS